MPSAARITACTGNKCRHLPQRQCPSVIKNVIEAVALPTADLPVELTRGNYTSRSKGNGRAEAKHRYRTGLSARLHLRLAPRWELPRENFVRLGDTRLAWQSNTSPDSWPAEFSAQHFYLLQRSPVLRRPRGRWARRKTRTIRKCSLLRLLPGLRRRQFLREQHSQETGISTPTRATIRARKLKRSKDRGAIPPALIREGATLEVIPEATRILVATRRVIHIRAVLTLRERRSTPGRISRTRIVCSRSFTRREL